MANYLMIFEFSCMTILLFGAAPSEGTLVDLNNSKNFHCVEPHSSLFFAFGSRKISINCSSSQCKVTIGKTIEDLQSVNQLWYTIYSKIFDLLSAKSSAKGKGEQIIHLSPYVEKCIKVETGDKIVHLWEKIQVLDVTCILLLISGLILFFWAETLSSSVKFYYTGGVGLGVLASLLIVVFIFSRLVPKKQAAYGILLGGWGVCCWILQKIWNNFNEILLKYKLYFVGYVGIAGFISFALCYWRGPVTDVRTQHIIKWSIQLFAIVLLFNCSGLMEVSVTIILTSILIEVTYMNPNYEIFNAVKRFIPRRLWRTKPKPRKFLTEEEYRMEGEIETKKALEELKQFCDSPQCSPWKTLSRLKSPSKFARFMEGDGHISDAEMTLHDVESSQSSESEDENLISEDDSEDSLRFADVKKPINGNGHYMKELFSEDED